VRGGSCIRTVSVFATNSLRCLTPVNVHGRATIWTGSARNKEVSIFDASTGALLKTFPLSHTPACITQMSAETVWIGDGLKSVYGVNFDE